MIEKELLIKLAAGYLKYRKPAVEMVQGVLKDSKGKILGAIKKPVTIKQLPPEARSMTAAKAKEIMALTDKERARVYEDVQEQLKNVKNLAKKGPINWGQSSYRKVL